MDLKEIQNLIKFVANSGVAEVKLEMDDVKITIRTTEGNVTETTYVQQMPSQNPCKQWLHKSLPVATVVEVPVVEETKYVTIKSQSLELL
jgi:acetyl-CoA carboxylase biotin carboxyl carrier protein